MWKNQKRVERLEEGLRRMQDRFDELERRNRSLDLEFVELYDKVKRQMSRMAKRYAVDNPDPQPNQETLDLPDNVHGLDPISARIHARRSRVPGANK